MTSSVPELTPPASVLHLLRDAAIQVPDRAALSFEGERLTYGAYAGLVGALARVLSRRVRPGDRVALLMQNSLDLVIATFAAQALRAQVVPLNPGYRERELSGMLKNAMPAMVLYDDSVTVDVAALCPGLSRDAILRTGDGKGFLSLSGQACDLPEHLPCHDDLAALQYTGGTTGEPKGVNILHRQIAFNIVQREALLPTRPDREIVLCTMPLFHVSALAMSLYLSLYARGELIIMRRFSASQAIEAIIRHQVTLLPAAPAIFHDLLRCPEVSQLARTHLRASFSGAAPLPRQVLHQFQQTTGCPIYEGYGLSEAGPCLAFNPMSRPGKPGSVGLPVPGSELQVVDLDSGEQPLAPGMAGEIRVRGPHVMAGYRASLPGAANTLRDGWLYTGDIAAFDDEGYLYIQGRRKDTINVGGFNVYPLEIEQVLLAVPEIREAAAFGVPDERLGQVVHAWVTPAPGHDVDTDALVAHCQRELARYKVPRRIGVVPVLPRTSIGKLARNALSPVPPSSSNATPSRSHREKTNE